MSVDLERILGNNKEALRKRQDFEGAMLVQDGIDWSKKFRALYWISRLADRLVPSEKRFTAHEKDILTANGAIIYALGGQTIAEQKEAGRKFPLTGYNGKMLKGLTPLQDNLVSREMEVAVFLDPDEALVPDSLGEDKTMARQKKLLKQDAEELRERLGLTDIDEIFPHVSEAVELVMAHRRLTGDGFPGWSDKTHQWLSIRTRTVPRAGDSRTACVGGSFTGRMDGPFLVNFPIDKGAKNLGVARWIVKGN